MAGVDGRGADLIVHQVGQVFLAECRNVFATGADLVRTPFGEVGGADVGRRMAQWREKLFAQMHHNASGAADFLNLPNNSVVELGSKIEI